jgi:hypothetical protein
MYTFKLSLLSRKCRPNQALLSLLCFATSDRLDSVATKQPYLASPLAQLSMHSPTIMYASRRRNLSPPPNPSNRNNSSLARPTEKESFQCPPYSTRRSNQSRMRHTIRQSISALPSRLSHLQSASSSISPLQSFSNLNLRKPSRVSPPKQQ